MPLPPPHSFTLKNNRRADCLPVIYNLLFVKVSLSTIGVHIKQCLTILLVPTGAGSPFQFL